MFPRKIKIGNKTLGVGFPCFIIAEAGVNHNGSIEIAKKIIDAALKTGADAIKFQTFRTEKLVTHSLKQAKYQVKNTGKKESQYDMLKRLELSYDDFRKLKKYCDLRGMIFLSTPHSCKEDVDILNEIGVPAFKLGSSDLTNTPFLEYVARKGKPVIISTGMGTMDEVRDAVKTIKKYNDKIIILHCTTSYPCRLDNVNLKAMINMQKEFNTMVGYSDHTLGTNVSLAAVILGACVIEKHFTLDKKSPGPDHKASIEPYEMMDMIKKIRQTEKLKNKNSTMNEIPEIKKILGNGTKKPTKKEEEIKKVARKSIVANTHIKKGSIITANMLTIKRPGTGIEPKYLEEIKKKKAKKNIDKDHVISLEDVE